MMKKVLFLLLAISLYACEKKIIYPSDQYPIPKKDTITKPTISVWGEFLLLDGSMYVTNHENGEQIVYNHFGPNKTTSSLRWGGSLFDIEELEQNKTTYAFYRPKSNSIYGDFVLNGDTSKHYDATWTEHYSSIVEDHIHPQSLMGGSARPFQGYTLSYEDSLIYMYIQNVEGSINGENCSYISKLTFKKIKSW